MSTKNTSAKKWSIGVLAVIIIVIVIAIGTSFSSIASEMSLFSGAIAVIVILAAMRLFNKGGAAGGFALGLVILFLTVYLLFGILGRWNYGDDYEHVRSEQQAKNARIAIHGESKDDKKVSTAPKLVLPKVTEAGYYELLSGESVKIMREGRGICSTDSIEKSEKVDKDPRVKHITITSEQADPIEFRIWFYDKVRGWTCNETESVLLAENRMK